MKPGQLAALLQRNPKLKVVMPAKKPAGKKGRTEGKGMTKAEMKKAKEEAIRNAFAELCVRNGLPLPVFEWKFDDRKNEKGKRLRLWRFDYSWPTHKVALEVEGGVWSQGRHTRPQGFIEDKRKYSEAAIQGWAMLYTFPDELMSHDTLLMVRRALYAKGWVE